jgi:hypothetical protein
MSTREIRPIDMQMVVEFLRENLRIEVETTREYTGDMDGGGSLYRDSHTIKLTLDGEVISEASI